MDRRVRIETKSTGQQLNGEQAKGWQPYWSGWAGKKDESVIKEGEDGKQIVATGRTTWTLRFQSGITPLMRIIDCSNGTEVIYNIEGISEVGRREALTLQTKRIN